MAITFATDEWAAAATEAINSHEGYGQAAKDWEGDFYFVVSKSAGFSEDTYMYLDLWHGKCRQSTIETNPSKKSAYTLTAPAPVWQRVLEGKLDPIRGLMSRQLKLKGNMMKIMKNPKQAVALVEALQVIDTDWP